MSAKGRSNYAGSASEEADVLCRMDLHHTHVQVIFGLGMHPSICWYQHYNLYNEGR